MRDKEATFYWDTSALLILIFKEPQTENLRQFVRERQPLPAYTSCFTPIEMEAALHRRVAEGTLKVDLSEVRSAMKVLESGLTLIWMDSKTVSTSRLCIMEYGLKPGDAIQLASALELFSEKRGLEFVCLDEKLSRAAMAARLKIAL